MKVNEIMVRKCAVMLCSTDLIFCLVGMRRTRASKWLKRLL